MYCNIFPQKVDLTQNLALDGRTMSNEELEYIKRAAILSIKSANRFILYATEKDKDGFPRIIMHNIPQPMLLPILGLISETHKNIDGQNKSVNQAKKLLNLP
jgi:hypothetical protein